MIHQHGLLAPVHEDDPDQPKDNAEWDHHRVKEGEVHHVQEFGVADGDVPLWILEDGGGLAVSQDAVSRFDLLCSLLLCQPVEPVPNVQEAEEGGHPSILYHYKEDRLDDASLLDYLRLAECDFDDESNEGCVDKHRHTELFSDTDLVVCKGCVPFRVGEPVDHEDQDLVCDHEGDRDQ